MTPPPPPTWIEGLDYYFDAGRMVLTARYLLARGHCCDNGCRHCPYKNPHSPTPEDGDDRSRRDP
jgi:Family of unknown function (DUF5522)